MTENFCTAFRKAPISIIHVIVVILMKIIPDIDILPAIVIDIADTYAQAITQVTLRYAGLFGNIGEFSCC
jgi:hypothetical protein